MVVLAMGLAMLLRRYPRLLIGLFALVLVLWKVVVLVRGWLGSTLVNGQGLQDCQVPWVK